MDHSIFVRELADLSAIVFRINRSVSNSKDLDDSRCVSGLQMHTLMALTKHKALNRTLNMTELADDLLMTRQQLTKVIGVLVKKGLVSRGADPNNRRHVMIKLTDRGEKFIEELVMSRPNIMSLILASLDDEDSQKLLDAIIVIKGILSKLAKAKAIK